MTAPRPVAECLAVYRNGDPLTDIELAALGSHMRALADGMFPLGDMFTLSAQYASQVASNCDMFLRHRVERRALKGTSSV